MLNDRLNSLQARVSTLEKLLLDLAKWTKFDLTKSDSDRKRGRCRRTGSRKGQVARKSTSGVRKGNSEGVATSRNITTIETKGVLNVDNDKSGPCLELVRWGCDEVLDSKDGFCTDDIKLEVEDPEIAPEGSSLMNLRGPSEISPFVIFCDEEEDSSSDRDSPAPSQRSGEEEEEEEEDDVEWSRRRMEKSQGVIRKHEDEEEDPNTLDCSTKATLRKRLRSKFRKYTPLTMPNVECTKTANPLVKIKKLSNEWLEKRSIDIPPPREPHPYQCPECTKSFKSPIWLQRHLETMHGKPKAEVKPQQRPCPYCPKVFHHKQKFIHHVRSHTNERPFLCSTCGFASKSIKQLNAHISTMHTADRKPGFQCDRCELRYFSKAALMKHQGREHGADGYSEFAMECPQCGLILADKHKLHRHLSDIHEDKRSFECHLCGQLFKRLQHLRQHISRHDNPKRRKKGPQKPRIRGSLVATHNPPTPTPIEEEAEGLQNEEGQDVKELMQEESSLITVVVPLTYNFDTV